ncbi:MAG: M24 family metallopeptidase [Chloroflexota bacterium]
MGSKPVVAEAELNIKLERIHKLLSQAALDALWLQRSSNFAWATCGASCYINTADSVGNAGLLVTPGGRFVLTDNIESARLMQEEGLADQGWEFVVSPWYEQKDKILGLTRGMKLGTDLGLHGAQNLSKEVAHLRSLLTTEEGNRYRQLASLCAAGMERTARAVLPGMTEYEIGGILSKEVESRGVQAVVNLIAADERIFAYRHPLPTSKKLEKYAMLILCGRKWGLICSLTRLIHFGELPDEVHRKAKIVTRIDAEMIAATRPGRTLGDVFTWAQSLYALAGYPDEWKLHHQGGSAGYAPREVTARPDSTEPILTGQVFAWNPSISGAKTEDTILVGEQSNEILTEMADWPAVEIQVGDQIIKRPAILEIL